MTKEGINTEEKILEAAREEFFAKGYAGARTTSIAQRAGVTHAMLHYYYRSKENLFEHFIETTVTKLISIMLSTITDNNECKHIFDKITALVENHFDFVATEPRLAFFLLQEILPYPERVALIQSKVKEQGFLTMMQQFQKELDENYRQGVIEKIDVLNLVLDVVSLNICSNIAVAPIGKAFNIDKTAFLQERKKENVRTILKRITQQK